MSPEIEIIQIEFEPGAPEVGALPDKAGSLPANVILDNNENENPPKYEGNGAG